MGRSLEAKSIKSARRVFEVLEFFDADHREASVMQIATRYGYPQSSASELLSYMVALGYLRRGSRGRTYQLSIRVAMLGTWVHPRLVREGRLLPLMDSLSQESGATAVLATHRGVHLQAIHAVGDAADRAPPEPGAELPLLTSAEGRALLGKCERGLVRRFIHRLNAEAAEGAAKFRFEDIAEQIDRDERRGYALVEDETGVSIAIVLPHGDPGEPLALALRAPAGADADLLYRRLRSAVAQHLGLVEVTSRPLVAPLANKPALRYAG